MNITTSVKKHIGKMLADHGFEFKRMRDGDWEFDKCSDQAYQKVFICKHRYDKKLYFELQSYSRKGGGRFRVEDLNIGFTDDEWHYSSQEDIERILTQMNEIIEQYGIPAMDLVIEKCKDNYIYTDAMAEQVYNNHAELARNFIEENAITGDGCEDSDIDNWFLIIDKKFKELQKTDSLQNIDTELIKTASFIGEKVVKHFGGKWDLHFNPKYKYQKCLIDRPSSYLYPNIDILKDLEDAFNDYQTFNVERMREYYKEMFSQR